MMSGQFVRVNRMRFTATDRQRATLLAPSTAVAWPEVVGGPKYESTDVDALLDEFKGDH